MVMVGVDWQHTGGLADQVVWLGLMVGSRLVPFECFCIHQMNLMNSRNGSAMMIAPHDSNVNICIIITSSRLYHGHLSGKFAIALWPRSCNRLDSDLGY